MHVQCAWLMSNDVTVWEEKFSASHTVPERSQLPLFGKHGCVNSLGKPLWVNTPCLQVIAPLFTLNKACQLLAPPPPLSTQMTVASWCDDVMALGGLSLLLAAR